LQPASALGHNSSGGTRPSVSQEIQPCNNLVVKGLPALATEECVREVFGAYGHIKKVKMLVQNAQIRSSLAESIALVCLDTVEDAKWIRQKLNGNIPFGLESAVTVNYTQPKGAMRPPPRWSPTTGVPGLIDSNSNHVYLKGLPSTADDHFLYRTFAVFGTVEAARVVRNGAGECAGVGFVRFAEPAVAREAADSMQGAPMYDGAPLYTSLNPDQQFQAQAPQSVEFQRQLLQLRQEELERKESQPAPPPMHMEQQQQPQKPMRLQLVPHDPSLIQRDQAAAPVAPQPAPPPMEMPPPPFSPPAGHHPMFPPPMGFPHHPLFPMPAPFMPGQPPPPPDFALMHYWQQEQLQHALQQQQHQDPLQLLQQQYMQQEQLQLQQVLLQQQQAQAQAQAQQQQDALGQYAQQLQQLASQAAQPEQQPELQRQQEQPQQEQPQGPEAAQGQTAAAGATEAAWATTVTGTPANSSAQTITQPATEQPGQPLGAHYGQPTWMQNAVAAHEGSVGQADEQQRLSQNSEGTALAAATSTAVASSAAAAAGSADGSKKRLNEGGQSEAPAKRPMPSKAIEWVERQEEFFPGAPKLPDGWVRAKARSTGKTYFLRLRDTYTTYNIDEVYRDQKKQQKEQQVSE